MKGDLGVLMREDRMNPLAQVVPIADSLAANIFVDL